MLISASNFYKNLSKIEMFKYRFCQGLVIIEKGDNMTIFSSKKGIVTHPAMMFAIALILGLVLAYLWINYTTIPNPFCP